MARTLDDLQRLLDQARGSYGGQFAGQPRITRRPERLRTLIAQAREVDEQARAVVGGAELAAAARSQAEGWEKELEAIEAARRGGPDAFKASSINQWLRDSFERYRRNFAGKNRRTRDIGILLEIEADVERRITEADALLRNHEDGDLARTREAAQRNLETYRQELSGIREARGTGPAEERAGLLAFLANQQFARYRTHFAGKSRIARRRQQLETIASVLNELRREMIELRDQGVDFEKHEDNIRVVEGHLETYKQETGRIRAARNGASRADRIRALAEDANEIFRQYRETFPGHRRSTRDEEALSDLWEQLWPIALEMEDLAREDDAEPVGSNLQKVRDSLRLYEREWGLIVEAKERAGEGS